jgi:hypothetical protein
LLHVFAYSLSESTQSFFIVNPYFVLIGILVLGIVLSAVLPKYRKPLGVLLAFVGAIALIPFILELLGFANQLYFTPYLVLFALGCITLAFGIAIFIYKPAVKTLAPQS